METGLLIALAVVAVLAVALAVVLTKSRSLAAQLETARADLAITRGDAVSLMDSQRTAAAEVAAAKTRLADAEALTATLRQERDSAFSERNEARLALQESEKKVALADQRVESVEKRLADWDKAREENLLSAKAAILEVGNALSTKLLADHKQETEAAKKQTEERITETQKAINDHFQSVVKSVASLNDQVTRNRDLTDTVWRALSSPGGAGYFAEIGLENCLKSFGLERGRDFMIQQPVGGDGEGRRLRPDAIVLLPFDSVLVIDSKASKFLVEVAEAEKTEGNIDAAYANLARTMNGHLRSLAAKDYRSAIVASYRDAGRSGEIRRILNVMYLPNDAALEKVTHADPEFQQKAARQEIIIAGRTGLAGIIGFARIEIGLGRQAENQERIIENVQDLLERLGTALGHIEAVGKGLKSAAENFVRLTGSVNSRLLPTAQKVMQLGVSPVKNKALPARIRSFHFSDDHATIEGEGAEVADPTLIEESGSR
jgi:DNA recombination protein RmuC